MGGPVHTVEMDRGQLASGQDVESSFRAARDHRGPVVIHVHGGLISREAALDGAPRTVDLYRAAGAFPIVPVWRTGFLEVLADDWARISAETLFRVLIDRVAGAAEAILGEPPGSRSPVFRRGLGKVEEAHILASAEAGGEFPPSLLKRGLREGGDVPGPSPGFLATLRDSLAQDRELTGVFEAALLGSPDAAAPSTRSALADRGAAPEPSLADPGLLVALDSETGGRSVAMAVAAAKLALRIVLAVVERYRTRTHHGLHATVVEEVLRSVYLGAAGRRFWERIKEYAAIAFSGPGPRPGGQALLSGLATLPAERRVVLVGHSAGAVFHCRLLDHAAAMRRPFEVVFLAPAVRHEQFEQALVRHPERLASGPWGLAFRMFTMDDARESADTLVRLPPPVGELKAFYPRSLLYLVSGLLEERPGAPILGLQRSLEPGAGLPDVQGFLRPPGRAVFAVADHPDDRMRCSSTSHAEFGDPTPKNETMASVLAIVRRGWG